MARRLEKEEALTVGMDLDRWERAALTRDARAFSIECQECGTAVMDTSPAGTRKFCSATCRQRARRNRYSVCLRDVVETLREKGQEHERLRNDEMADALDYAADFLEQTFTET